MNSIQQPIEEISENETMWAEEKGDPELAQLDPASPRNVGISAGGINADLDALGPEAPAGDTGLSGAPESNAPGAAAAVGASPTV